MSAAPTDTATIIKAAGPKWSERYNDEVADLELISSDGWHFKVHSYRLQTVSPVFREMIAMATTNNQRDPITFTDIQVEVGVVVRLFLDAIYTRAIEGVGLSEYTNSTIHLIDFARKWECQEILDMIERDIRFNISADDRRDLFDQFLLAIKMEKYELAGHCLRCDPPMIWNNDPVDGSGEWDGLVLYAKSDQTVKAFQNLDPIAESSVFDLTASAYSNFLSLPPNIVWTLLRSSHLARIDAGGDTYECKLGNEFVKLMRLGYPHTFKDVTDVPKKRARDEI